jgi:hypothetical protein
LPLSDGRVVLAGTIGDLSDKTGWIGMVDANWQLVWERVLAQSGGNDLALLSDGDLIVSGPHIDGTESEEGEPHAVQGMARFDVEGNVKWQASVELEGYEPLWERQLVVLAGQPRVIAQTTKGLVMIAADNLGVLSTQLLDTTLALYLGGVTALPKDRLAIASSRTPGAILTIVEADGTVVWEKSYGRNEDAGSSGVAYDATRGQIVISGSYRGPDRGSPRTWMIATDLDGEQQWELTRLPQEYKGADGLVASVSPDRGPDLRDVIVGADGTLVALGWTTFDLSFFVVGTDACE